MKIATLIMLSFAAFVATQTYAECSLSVIQQLKSTTEQGNPCGQVAHATAYYEGDGVLMSKTLAAEWYSKTEGHIKYAEHRHSVRYEHDKGVEEDLNVAVGKYRKAAEQGDSEAQYNLGRCYTQESYLLFAKHFASLGNSSSFDWLRSLVLPSAFAPVPEDVEKNEKEAFKWYHKAAEQGHAKAQCALGECYYSAIGVEEDKKEAVKWYSKAVEQRLAEAQYNLGGCYYSGAGVEKDMKAAAGWFLKAAEQGLVHAQWALGGCHYRGEGVKEDMKEAVKWYRKAAEQGFVLAQYDLGVCYENGEGMEKDLKVAAEWYRKAAENGFAPAQCALGVCFCRGEGVEKDMKEAVVHFRKAAESWMGAKAQYNLGVCYYRGEGVQKDLKVAAEWYGKAAYKKLAEAKYNLGVCYENGEGVKKDLKEAVKWYREAAEQGHVKAQYNLGACFYRGEGVEKDLKEAVKWYSKAAEQRLAEAQYNLGACFYRGEGVEKDLKEAVKWYRKAAEQGSTVAQHRIGDLYYSGQGLPQDFSQAVKWYRKAAEQGNADAQYRLGILYYGVQSLPRFYNKDIKSLRKAAEQGNVDAQYALGIWYYCGVGEPQDFNKATEWFQKAKEQGNPHAGDYLLTIRSLQVEERGEDVAALTIMMNIAKEKPSNPICWSYIGQISRVLQRIIRDAFTDGQGTMLEKRIIVDRLERFDAVRDSIEFLVNELEQRLGDEEYDLSDTKKMLECARNIKEKTCTNRTSYVSYYVAWPYLQEARRLFNSSIWRVNSSNPNNKWNEYNDREKIRQGVRLLTRALNKELLEQSDEKVRDYVISLKKQLKDLVYESEYNEFISESTLWDSNDQYKKTGADAWWSSSKYYKGESQHSFR